MPADEFVREVERRWDEGVRGDAHNVRLLEAAIASGELPAEDLTGAHYMIAVELKMLGDPAGALPHFEAVIADAPPEIAIVAHDSAGGIRIASGDYLGAEHHYRSALELDRDHPFSPDWLVLLATCIVEGEEHPSTELIEEAHALADEAYALLTGPEHERFVTDYPYPRAVLQAMVVRALTRARTGTNEALRDAEEQFRSAERYGLDNLGPDLSRQHLTTLYQGWVKNRGDLGLPEEAERLVEHARRQLRGE